MDVQAAEVPVKDAEELELEKLVFGDFGGFEDNLKAVENVYELSDLSGSESEAESSSEAEEGLEQLEDGQLFFVDGGEGVEAPAAGESEAGSSEEPSDEDSSSDEDAWYDSADEHATVSLLASDRVRKLRQAESDDVLSGRRYIARLRSQFEKIYPRPEWADAESSSEGEGALGGEHSDEDAEMVLLDAGEDEQAADAAAGNVKALANLLKRAQTYTATQQSKLLAPGHIDIHKLKDANDKLGSRSAIQTISFHPTHPIALISGYDRTLRVYHLDGKINSVVTSLHLRDTPVQNAYFNPNPAVSKVYAGGRRKFMYSWDLSTGEINKISRLYGHEATQRSFENFKVSPKGDFIGLVGNSGWINILSASTTKWVKGFKIEGTVVDFDWDSKQQVIFVVNTSGQVWEFNFSTQKVLKRWTDETGNGITKIRVSGGKNNRWLAVGSNSGVVNVYDRLSDSAKPLVSLDHLVTTISTLEFSSDGQILCMASRAKKDQLKLVHLPSGKVFGNWPTSGTPLGRVTAAKFSPNNQMLCIGNEAGKARLWRLNHY